MKLLKNKQRKSYRNAKICYSCKEKFEDEYAKDKKYRKVRDHCHYTGQYRDAAHSICNLKYSLPKEFLIVSYSFPYFHKRFNYGYHFIIKELALVYEKILKNK